MKNYKKAAAGCLALALAMSLAPVSIFAETEQAESVQAETTDKNASNKKCGDNLDWELNGDTLTISGTGDMYDLYDSAGKYSKPWLHSESQIKHIVIEEGVTSIGAYAFQLCTVLEDVSIPSTVTKIGFGAFQDCKELTEATVPNGIIGESAFIRCLKLRTVTIGAGVTNMGISAFENCNSLEAVYISDMAAWCKIDFGGIYANPLQKAHHLYLNGTLVTDVNIPEGITEIRSYAFIDDQDFTSVSIPSTVTKIGNHAFFNDKGITAVTVPSSGITSIGDCAFQGCSSLADLSIPSTVRYIGSYCFAFNPFTEINVKGGYIGDHAFYGCGAVGYAVLGDEVSYIGESAFENCAGISELDLGYYVSCIGDNAFSGCDNLTSSRGLVDYGGTADTWSKIQMGSGNSCLTGAKKIINRNRGTSMAPVITPKQEVVFGRYEQDNNTENGAEDIVWYVLDVQGDKALIVSRDVLDFKQYAESIKPYDISWEDSELRSWLNGSFYSSAFNESEKAAIYSTTLTNDANPVYGTDGGAATTDNVFILSTAEAQLYFANDAQRRSCATAAARASSDDSALYHDDFKSSYWWLRNPGLFGYAAMFTHYNGAPVYDGMAGANFIGGVRPAMWVNKDSIKAEEDKVSSFVERLYTTLLGRASEEKGKAEWAADLRNGRSAADAASGFVLSAELKNQNLSNGEFVDRMYLTFLDREADESGKADWVGILDKGCSYGYILNSFAGSQEFIKLCKDYGITAGSYESSEPRDKNVDLTAFVSRMYTKALGRAYDVVGLNDWTGSYLDGTKSADDIAYGFILSQEFINKGLSDDEYVDTLYRTFFDREPDEGGKSGWLTELANGASRQDVLDGFLGAQEFENLKKSFGV